MAGLDTDERGRQTRPKVASRSVSRILYRVSPATTICLGPPSPVTSMRPTRRHRAGNSSAQGPKSPLGLAPDGVYPAADVTTGAGGLLHHRFTLTSRGWRSTFCCTCPRVTPGGRYPPSCPVESGLSSTACATAAVRPTRHLECTRTPLRQTSALRDPTRRIA